MFKEHHFDLIIHFAAQPSHDKAREIPRLDFEANAMGALNLLDAARQKCPDAVFVLMSTNKVYGDAPRSAARLRLGRKQPRSRTTKRERAPEAHADLER